MASARESRFDDADAFEAAISAALQQPPSWEVRGRDMVLCAELTPGLRLEVVPLDGQRAQVRVQGVLDRGSLVDWVERLRLPRLVERLRPPPRPTPLTTAHRQARPCATRLQPLVGARH